MAARSAAGTEKKTKVNHRRYCNQPMFMASAADKKIRLFYFFVPTEYLPT
jgi:hypothetical protein